MSKKKNFLLEKVIEIMRGEPKGKILDIGCGDGEYSFNLKEKGFEVIALDIDEERFKYKNKIEFLKCDLTKGLPFPNEFFDYVLFLEVIEHIYNHSFVIEEIYRILKPNGLLILSTPNILNIRSRLRFLFEGNFDFFREPTLDYYKLYPERLRNIHLLVWRYQELEFLLFKNNFCVEEIYTDYIRFQFKLLSFIFKPLIFIHCKKKERKFKKIGLDYRRINRILLSQELFLGRHLIIRARKVLRDNLKEE